MWQLENVKKFVRSHEGDVKGVNNPLHKLLELFKTICTGGGRGVEETTLVLHWVRRRSRCYFVVYLPHQPFYLVPRKILSEVEADAEGWEEQGLLGCSPWVQLGAPENSCQ